MGKFLLGSSATWKCDIWTVFRSYYPYVSYFFRNNFPHLVTSDWYVTLGPFFRIIMYKWHDLFLSPLPPSGQRGPRSELTSFPEGYSAMCVTFTSTVTPRFVMNVCPGGVGTTTVWLSLSQVEAIHHGGCSPPSDTRHAPAHVTRSTNQVDWCYFVRHGHHERFDIENKSLAWKWSLIPRERSC